MTQHFLLTGKVQLDKSDKEALVDLIPREALSKAVNAYLKSKNMNPGRIIHHNGEIIVEVQQEIKDGTIAEFSQVKTKRAVNDKPMSSGWRKEHHGLTQFLLNYFKDQRSRGRRELKMDDLLDRIHNEYSEAKRPMDEQRLTQYLHDKRYFKTIKYSGVKRTVSL